MVTSSYWVSVVTSSYYVSVVTSSYYVSVVTRVATSCYKWREGK